jgi:ankyrin repeat protein
VVPADPYSPARRRTQFAEAVAEDDVALAAKLLATDRSLLSINPSVYLGRDYPAPPGASRVKPVRLRFSSPLAPFVQVAGQRPLHLAAERASAKMVDLLIRKGHPVNVATRQGYAPLHFASIGKDSSVLKVLLSRGAGVDAASARGFTPLQCAIIAFQSGSAKLLLAAGADPNAGGKSGCPALLCALRQGDVELADLLLNRGADPRANYRGYSALHMAVAKGTTYMVRRLLRAGCRPDASDARGRTPLQLLLSGPRPWDSLPDLARPDLRTQDPLALSMTNDNPFADRRLSGDGLGLVEALLEGGADPNAADASGTTPLLALARGLLEKGTSGAEELDAWSAKCAKLLVSHGARAGTRDRSGASALAIAEKRGAEALAAALR